MIKNIEEYGAIKWLREKQIRDRIEAEMQAKYKKELEELGMSRFK